MEGAEQTYLWEDLKAMGFQEKVVHFNHSRLKKWWHELRKLPLVASVKHNDWLTKTINGKVVDVMEMDIWYTDVYVDNKLVWTMRLRKIEDKRDILGVIELVELGKLPKENYSNII